jgi:hypothetical protein
VAYRPDDPMTGASRFLTSGESLLNCRRAAEVNSTR